MTQLSDSSPAAQPATISGRRITVVVLVTLAVTGLLFYWIATSYATYNAARRQTDRSWRELATVLADRYQQYDAQVAGALDDDRIDAAVGEQWRSARDSFSRTTLPTQQAVAAQSLEQTLATLPQSSRLPDANWLQLPELYREYAAAADKQRRVGGSAGSQVLKLMLNLPDPPDFALAELSPTESISARAKQH